MSAPHLTRRRFLGLAAAAALAACTRDGADRSTGRLRVLTWPDYIDPETVPLFTQVTGTPVDYVER